MFMHTDKSTTKSYSFKRGILSTETLPKIPMTAGVYMLLEGDSVEDEVSKFAEIPIRVHKTTALQLSAKDFYEENKDKYPFLVFAYLEETDENQMNSILTDLKTKYNLD
jgi:hypothetical protein